MPAKPVPLTVSNSFLATLICIVLVPCSVVMPYNSIVLTYVKNYFHQLVSFFVNYLLTLIYVRS